MSRKQRKTTGDLRSEYGMACPECDAAQTLTINIRCSAILSINGSEAQGDHEWEPTSDCFCDECGHNGVVADFCVADGEAVQS